MNKANFLARHLPETALLSVAFIWGITFPLGKYVIATVPVFSYLGVRFLIASAILFPLSRRGLKQATRYDLTVSLLIGLALFGAFAFQTMGLFYTTAGKASFANGLYAVLTPFLYFILFKTPLKKTAIVASVMACVGVAMLGGDISGLTEWDFGVTLVIISTVFTALQIVGVGRYADLVDPMLLTFLQTITVSVACLLIGFFFETWPEEISGQVWLAIIFMAVFATVVAYFVQCRVQQKISHTVTAVIISMESVFGALLSWIFLDEKFTLIMITGCCLLFAAMLIAQMDSSTDASRPKLSDRK